MKKLMIAVAVIACAAVSQAAQISWGNVVANSPIYDLTGTTKLSYANATQWGFQIFLVDSDGNKVGSSATINNMTAGSLSSAATTYTFGSGEGQYTTGDTFTILATMTVSGKNYEMTITPANNAITATDNSGKDTFVWANGGYGGLSGTATAGSQGSWTAASVPEPTSGLLLLLGMAGLALKRKRA